MKLLRNKVGEEEDRRGIVSRWTGIPVARRCSRAEREKLLRHGRPELGERVVGQDPRRWHCRVGRHPPLARGVCRTRIGLIGSFLFLGTYRRRQDRADASALARISCSTPRMRWFGIDMSEFMEKHSVARLVGAPPGYVGYEQGGYLTEIGAASSPYSVILLDEIEKAHADVFNVLLQVLDDGRLTDGQGRTVDFRNTVIIMTSNLGSQRIQSMAGNESYDAMKTAVMEVVGEHFRPEFVNRIDDAVVFHPLAREDIRRIVDIQLELLHRRLAERDLVLDLDDAARDLLADAGFDPVYGARPLKRAIQTRVENPLAQAILRGDFAPGDRIRATVDGDNLAFQRG